MKRLLVGMRKAVSPQRDTFARLMGGIADLPGFGQEDERYFRDIYDHLIRISDLIDSYRDLLTGAMDVYLSTVSNRLKSVMKQLTIIATIFLPLAWITGFLARTSAGSSATSAAGKPSLFSASVPSWSVCSRCSSTSSVADGSSGGPGFLRSDRRCGSWLHAFARDPPPVCCWYQTPPRRARRRTPTGDWLLRRKARHPRALGIGTRGSGGPRQTKVHGHPVIPWERVVRVGSKIVVRD